jgi:hypothetical protein
LGPKKSKPPLEGKIFIVHPFNWAKLWVSPPKNNYIKQHLQNGFIGNFMYCLTSLFGPKKVAFEITLPPPPPPRRVLWCVVSVSKCVHGRITQNRQCKNISGPLYPHHVSTESEVKPAVKAGRDLATLVSYLMVPRPLPTPAPPLVGEPIVEGYNVKTHNFYEIKVDF